MSPDGTHFTYCFEVGGTRPRRWPLPPHRCKEAYVVRRQHGAAEETLNSRELEILIGLWPGYLRARGKAEPAHRVANDDLERARWNLLSRTQNVNVATWLVAQGMHIETLDGEPLSPAEIQESYLQEVARRRRELEAMAERLEVLPPSLHFSALARPVSELDSKDRARALAQAIYRRADHKGCDVRLDISSPFRAAKAREGIDTRRWVWVHPLSVPWETKLHINCLELQALFMGLRWRLRTTSLLGSRLIFLLDSQVAMSVAAKGRSSSKQLNRILRRFNAYVLATFSQPCFAFVNTHLNPADGPSRLGAVESREPPTNVCRSVKQRRK